MNDNFGSGPKKPKATFGDVMRGIPAGKGGEADFRGGRGDKKGGGGGGGGRGGGDRGPRRDRQDRPPRDAAAPGGSEPQKTEGAAEGAASSEPRRDEKPRHEKKPKGPLVVVRRASGVVETRTVSDAPSKTVSSDAAATSEPVEAAAETPPPAPKPKHVPNDALYAEVPENQSFAEMFEHQQKTEGGAGRKSVRVGEKVKAKIFQLGADTAFLSLGGKSEAMIDLRELKDDEGILRHGVGDEVEAYVVEAGAKGIILSRQMGKGAASLARLQDARVSGMPVEGLVLSVNKGGFEIAVGDIRAFCPISQMDIRFVDKPEQFVGEKHQFRVTEVREKNVVLSRRALLEEESKKLAEETRKTLAVGKVMKGRITGVRDFGAFADLGGIEGMIPVGELSHVRVGHPNEVVKVGDEVEVEIIRLEAAEPNSPDKGKRKERITLSLRSRQEDPWIAALAEIKEGDRLKGRIARLQAFGAFVELRPGVDGLIHISALSDRRIAHPRDAVRVGDEVEVHVEKVDPTEKRVALRLVKDGQVLGEQGHAAAAGAEAEPKQQRERAPAESRGPAPREGAVVNGTVDRIESYGVFVKFPGGKGLVPGSETGTDRGTDLKRHFQPGQELRVLIQEIDPKGKIKLSITGAARAEERAEMEAWKAEQNAKNSGGGKKGFGTLGDLLKNFKPQS